MSKKKRQPRQLTTREVLVRLADEIADVRRRYDAVFQYAHGSERSIASETVVVTLEGDMKAGETVNVRLPIRFMVR